MAGEETGQVEAVAGVGDVGIELFPFVSRLPGDEVCLAQGPHGSLVCIICNIKSLIHGNSY